MVRPFALATVALLFLASGPTARAQSDASPEAGTDAGAPATAPAESACASATPGSDCSSSTTMAGGTCIAGCCCHYLAEPAGELSCEACLACSDTANADPTFAKGACSDGGGAGSTPSFDAGPVFGGDSGSGAPSAASTPSSGCSSASAGPSGGDAALAAFALGAAFCGLARKLRRAKR